MTSIPLAAIIVGIVLGLNAIIGALRGFVRMISGLVAFILSCILVSVLLPPVTTYLRTTPVYSFIQEQCEKVGSTIINNMISQTLGGNGLQDGNISDISQFVGTDGTYSSSDLATAVDSVTADDGSGLIDREKLKAALSARGYDPSIIDSMSDAQLESYAQQLIGAGLGMVSPAFLEIPGGARSLFSLLVPDTPVLLEESGAFSGATDGSQNASEILSQVTAGMDRIDQTKFIESLPLPDEIKKQLETFNNSNGYLKLGATDFASYIVNYFASLILNILAFFVTLLVTWIIIRLILGALSLSRIIPLFGAADHLLGLVLGVVQGVLIVWGLFLVLSMFATTPAGSQLMNEIQSTPLLALLYNSNLFINSASGAIKGIM